MTLELVEQMMRLAQNLQDPGLLLTAHLALGVNLYWGGEFTSARAHVEQGLSLYDPQQPPPAYSTVDHRVDCLIYAAWSLWPLGYPDQALKSIHEALALAERLSHPYSLTTTLALAAWFYLLRREWQLARERAEEVMTLATEQGFPFWLAQGTMIRGEALAEQGQVKEGMVQMQQGLAAFRATGAELSRIRILSRLAPTYAKAGQVEEGLNVLAEALVHVEKTGERWNEAELYRLKGELTLAQSRDQSLTSSVPSPQFPTPQAEAEACFHKAIDIARRQSAKSLELRAVMSLSRLWQQQGKKEEARQMLAEIYGWFTEGFDTADLKEAKALLDELS